MNIFLLLIAITILFLLALFLIFGRISLKTIIFVILFILVLPFLFQAFIWVYVNSTPETVIPNVMGLPKEEAISILEKHNLKGEVIGVSFSKEPNGTVISQRPEAGRKVKEGRIINLIVSINESTVEVPNIVGKTTEEAYYILKESGLKPGNVTFIYSEGGQGYIIEQNPSAGNTVQKGTEINVKILVKPNELEENNNEE